MIDALGPIYDLLPIARETKAVITYMHNFANEVRKKTQIIPDLFREFAATLLAYCYIIDIHMLICDDLFINSLS